MYVMIWRKYLPWLSIGAVLTLSLPIKLCACVSDGFKIAVDIAAMLGGGIFCSALVSCFVERQNEKYKREVQKKQLLSP